MTLFKLNPCRMHPTRHAPWDARGECLREAPGSRSREKISKPPGRFITTLSETYRPTRQANLRLRGSHRVQCRYRHVDIYTTGMFAFRTPKLSPIQEVREEGAPSQRMDEISGRDIGVMPGQKRLRAPGSPSSF